MNIKGIFTKAGDKIRNFKLTRAGSFKPDIDEQGLITEQPEETAQAPAEQKDTLLVKTAPVDKTAQLEKLQEGFNKLIDQLEGINENLNRQVSQHQELMSRMDHLPELLHSVPAAVNNQLKVTAEMLEQLKADSAKDQRFIEAVEKIPTETAKQTDALENIDHQLAAAADSDAQMAQSFNRFTQNLDKLDQSTANQTDSILQMSRTFAASDRHLKYMISRDKKRMFWLFIIAMGVCVFAILALVGTIIYLAQ